MPSSTAVPGKRVLIQISKRPVWVFFAIWLAVGIIGGCATHQIAGGWKHADIVVNGMANEWPDDPPFVDDELEMTVHVVSDSQSLALCVETRNETLQRQLLMDGLNLWVDPQGGQKTVFGIHVRGGSPMDRGHGPRPEAGGVPSADKDHRPGGERAPMPSIAPIAEVAITYSDATGSLTMAMDEVRRSGIDIGVGQSADRALVYEFNIAFKAAPSLEELAPGRVIGIGILSGGAERGDRKVGAADNNRRQDGPPGGGGGSEPGGRMGGPPGDMMGGGPMGAGPGGPPSSGKKDNVGVWLQVQLAGGAKG